MLFFGSEKYLAIISSNIPSLSYISSPETPNIKPPHSVLVFPLIFHLFVSLCFMLDTFFRSSFQFIDCLSHYVLSTTKMHPLIILLRFFQFQVLKPTIFLAVPYVKGWQLYLQFTLTFSACGLVGSNYIGVLPCASHFGWNLDFLLSPIHKRPSQLKTNFTAVSANVLRMKASLVICLPLWIHAFLTAH